MPPIAAWATSKHLVPIQLISIIYVILKCAEKLKKTPKANYSVN